MGVKQPSAVSVSLRSTYLVHHLLQELQTFLCRSYFDSKSLIQLALLTIPMTRFFIVIGREAVLPTRNQKFICVFAVPSISFLFSYNFVPSFSSPISSLLKVPPYPANGFGERC